MPYNCAYCGQPLSAAPEPTGDWIIRCLVCGARNIIVTVFKAGRLEVGCPPPPKPPAGGELRAARGHLRSASAVPDAVDFTPRGSIPFA